MNKVPTQIKIFTFRSINIFVIIINDSKQRKNPEKGISKRTEPDRILDNPVPSEIDNY